MALASSRQILIPVDMFDVCEDSEIRADITWCQTVNMGPDNSTMLTDVRHLLSMTTRFYTTHPSTTVAGMGVLI